jgi:transposase-like protein
MTGTIHIQNDVTSNHPSFCLRSISYRDIEERLIERGLAVDDMTIWRWVQLSYAPELNKRCRRELKPPTVPDIRVAGD